VCCLHCDRWLGEEETAFGNYAAMYDVTRLSSRLARTYVVELSRRMLSFTEELEAILAGTPDVRNLDTGTRGRIGFSSPTMKTLLSRLALGSEWIKRPGGAVVLPFPASVGDGLARMEAALKRLDDGGMSMKEELSAVGAARGSVTPQT
jgi:hypothetical protein